MKTSFLPLVVIVVIVLIKFLILPAGGKPEGGRCREHNECSSGACDHYKKDQGRCASASCKIGDKADNNKFFCNENGQWEQSKNEGQLCEQDYECYQPTCFMIPNCDLTDIPRTKALCKDNVCVYEIEQDECEKQGLQRVLSKDAYFKTDDGQCIQSMAQMLLPTVCAPCGNGICDKEIESECNCPEDCK